MWNNTNPAELFSGTTWELITAGKYIQSGSTALQTGGSNSVSIAKVNLPNIKLKIDTFSVTTQPHTHGMKGKFEQIRHYWDHTVYHYPLNQGSGAVTDNGGGQNTGTASPSTETLGSGAALSIQPSYITLKFWKRLS